MATMAEEGGVAPAPGDYVVDPKRDRLVIIASSLGTVFEWYDFFIYGTLATVLAQHFFPWAGATGGFLLHLGGVRRRLLRPPDRRDPVRHPRRPAGAQIHLPRSPSP